MATIKMTPEQLALYIREDRVQFRKQILQGIRAAARRAKDHLRNQTPVSFGTLRASWEDQALNDGAVVRNDAPYAAAVEGGTRPYNINRSGIDNLILWAMQKFGVDSTEARGIAFGVARKLATRGQAGKFFVRDAMPTLQRMVAQEIAARLGKHRR